LDVQKADDPIVQIGRKEEIKIEDRQRKDTYQSLYPCVLERNNRRRKFVANNRERFDEDVSALDRRMRECPGTL